MYHKRVFQFFLVGYSLIIQNLPILSTSLIIHFIIGAMSNKSQASYKLRPKQRVNIFDRYDLQEDDLNELIQEDEYKNHGGTGNPRPKRNRKSKREELEKQYQVDLSDDEISESNIYDENAIVDRLPENPYELEILMKKVKEKIKHYKSEFLRQQEEKKGKKSHVGDNSIPICADITNFNWNQLIKNQTNFGMRMFDVIMMDPPWKLSTSQPSRGVAIQYNSLSDEQIQKIPIEKLQQNGFLLIWTINAKLALTVKLMKKWNYKIVDSIAWIKSTVNQKIAKGHGFYLQHAKQTCIIGVKGNPVNLQREVQGDLIFSLRRGQSQKPCETYELIEKLIPNGFYLQIFGRRNNLREKWVTIGNEL